MTAYAETPADTLGLSDTAEPVKDAIAATTDTLGLTDTVATVKNAPATKTDTLGLTDTAVPAKNIFVTVTDTLGLTDTAVPLFDLAPGTIPAYIPIGPWIQDGPVDDDIPVATIDGSVPVPGPVWIADDDSFPYIPTVTAKLYEMEPAGGRWVEVANALDNAFGITWFDELDGPGYGVLNVPLSETAAIAELQVGRYVGCFIGGTHAFSWKIEEFPKYVEISQGEEADQAIQIKGRGWAAALDDAIVFPVIGHNTSTRRLSQPATAIRLALQVPAFQDPFTGPNRIFSFASPDFPNLNLTDWPHVYAHYKYHELQPVRKQRIETSEGVWEDFPAPYGLPYGDSELYADITAGDALTAARKSPWWIWPTHDPYQIGWAFFVGDLLEPDLNRVLKIETTADNLFTMFVDGTPIMGESVDISVWQGWKEITTHLKTNRWHRFACAVRNTPFAWQTDETPSAPYNPGGWLMAASWLDGAGVIEDWALTTNPYWRGFFSAKQWPGWTAGQIMLRLIDEAAIRSVSFGALEYGFKEFAGSDGLPWAVEVDGESTVFIPWFEVSHGSSYLQVLDQLASDGWVHWRMQGGGLVLDMYGADSPGVNPQGTTYTAGVNIRSLEREHARRYANSLLVAWEDGYSVVEDTAAIATYGKYEDVFSSDAITLEEMNRAGKTELAKRSLDVEAGAIVLDIEPTDWTDTPYLAFNPGHFVSVPSVAGGSSSVRVFSITVNQDDLGNAEFTLEVNGRWPVEDRSVARLLKSIGGKSLGETGTRGKVD